MSNQFLYKTFSRKEEKVNIATHAFGFFLSTLALFFLVTKSLSHEANLFPSFAFYGLALVALYLCSTLVHSAVSPKRRSLLNLLDFIAIDFLITATYMPIVLFQINKERMNFFLLFIWMMTIVSVLAKLIWKEKAKRFSMINFAVMGLSWMFIMDDMFLYLPKSSLVLFLMGIAFYALSFVFYYLEKLPYHHGIFHLLILLGSTCHFIEIYTFIY